MAKRAQAGALRTRIRIFDLPRDEHGEVLRDQDGYEVKEPVNVFGPGATRQCQWVNAWGSEVYAARQAFGAPALSFSVADGGQLLVMGCAIPGRPCCWYARVRVFR